MSYPALKELDLSDIPAFDAHTHVDVKHLTARGLHDILLYHMVVSDLYSAGCPDGARLPEEPDENEAVYRLERAVPYIKYIQNTSCFSLVKKILYELYDWEDPITGKNWHLIHEKIKNKGVSHDWAREIMKKSNIIKINTELWRGREGSFDSMMNYSLEWSFFTRSQWGRFDTALLELEHAWNHDAPAPPLPVTVNEENLKFTRKIKSIDDVQAAMKHYFDKIPFNRIITIASHFSTDISYRRVTEGDMEKAIQLRHSAGPEERDIYANFVFEEFLKEFAARGLDMPLQFSLAAEPLPYETGSKMRCETPFELAEIIARYPGIKFNFFLANMAQNQTFCTLARELPNLSLNGYWWHNFFPSFIPHVLSERLDMLPINKQIGFFSDAYSLEWCYAKAGVIRYFTSRELYKRVERGQFDTTTARDIAGMLFGGTAARLFNLDL